MAHVLIVDDELLVAETLRCVFEKNGFAVDAVHTTDEALEAARSCAPDLLVCDLDMPGKDGGVLIQAMKRLLPRCPILVLTGLSDADVVRRVRGAAGEGKLSMLLKPCPPLELLRVAGQMMA